MGQERNYGIDLLRIVAIYMVIVLHVLSVGGILYTVDLSSPLYVTTWLMEFLTYCAVNCYALISGYVGIQSRFRLSSILLLWLQVSSTTLAITCAFYFWGERIVTLQEIWDSCMPLKNQYYWYFTAYVCLYFMTPFLNKCILSIEDRMVKRLIWTLMLLFCVVPTFFETDLFVTHGGYSPLWLIILYIVGGFVRRYQSRITIKKRILLCGYLGAVMITLISKLVIEYLTPRVSFELLKSNFLMNYNSPTMVVSGLCLLLLFANLKIKKMKKIISLLAPATFGVYIIHTHPMMLDRFISNDFLVFREFGVIQFVMAVIITAMVIFMICSVMELFRIKVFKVLHIPELCRKIEEKFCKRII